MPDNLKRLFDPQSVAVVGASAAPLKPGGRVVRYLLAHGFRGQIFPVNPTRAEIAGLRCYPRLSAIGQPVDLVIVAVPAAEVPAVIAAAIRIGAGAAIIFSGGFREMASAEGDALHQQLTDLIQQSDIQVIGPNSNGMVNVHGRATLSMAINYEGQEALPPGSVALISQGSGGGLNALCREMGVTFSYLVNTGNEVGVQSADCIRYLATDPETRVIALYVEGLRDPGQMLAACRAAHANGKPVVALKAGRTVAGSRAAASHTGAVAVPDRICQAFFRKAGIVQVENPWDLAGTAQLLKDGRFSPGPNLAIITNSGSMGSMICDNAEVQGFNVLTLSTPTLAELRSRLPAFVQAGNPVDVTTPPLLDGSTILQDAANIVLTSEPVDHLIVSLMLGGGFPLDTLCPQITALFRSVSVPMAVVVAGSASLDGARRLWAEGVPTFRDIGSALRSLAAARAAGAVMHAAGARAVGASAAGVANATTATSEASHGKERPAQRASGQSLDEEASGALARQYGIPMARSTPAATPEAAVAAAEHMGYPVVLKVLSADIPHKSDAGGVRLNLCNASDVRAAADGILDSVRKLHPDARLGGFLVQEMCPPGVEVVVGATRDPVFGATILFGLGGIAMELYQDVALGVSPLTRPEARDLIRRTRSHALLTGFRGAEPGDVEAVVDLVLAVDRLMQSQFQVQELDLNPVLVYPAGRGVKVVDALAVVRE